MIQTHIRKLSRMSEECFTGETGVAGYLAYDKETDRLEAVENIKEYNEEPMEVMGDCDDLKVPF